MPSREMDQRMDMSAQQKQLHGSIHPERRIPARAKAQLQRALFGTTEVVP